MSNTAMIRGIARINAKNGGQSQGGSEKKFAEMCFVNDGAIISTFFLYLSWKYGGKRNNSINVFFRYERKKKPFLFATKKTFVILMKNVAKISMQLRNKTKTKSTLMNCHSYCNEEKKDKCLLFCF